MSAKKAPRPSRAGSRKPELTDAEWSIMRAVWQHEPCPAPTVQEALASQTGWAYSTVKTMMDRMVDKGLLLPERVRHLILYRSAITRTEARRGEILRAVQRAFDGAITPMMQFLLDRSHLSAEELDEMERLIREKRAKAGPDKPGK